MPFSGIQFSVYHWVQREINPNKNYDPAANAAAGAAAGGLAAFVTTPLDVIKTVLNTQERLLTTMDPNCETCPVLEGFWKISFEYLTKLKNQNAKPARVSTSMGYGRRSERLLIRIQRRGFRPFSAVVCRERSTMRRGRRWVGWRTSLWSRRWIRVVGRKRKAGNTSSSFFFFFFWAKETNYFWQVISWKLAVTKIRQVGCPFF